MNDYGLATMLVLAYLLGATPTSYVAGKLGRGVDLRQHGSQNLGATNVYRVLGWRYAIPVGLVDVAKGVATAAGVFLALAPVAVLISLLIWGATVWFTGYVSVASLTVALLFPLWVWVTTRGEPYTFWAAIVLALLLVYTHRRNIQRLKDGTENRFRTRKGMPA